MGTNYYVQRSCPNACAHCMMEDQHIGKQSAGWKFLFRAHKPDLVDRAAWEKVIQGDAVVVDENCQEMTPAEFWEQVDLSRVPAPGGKPKLSHTDLSSPSWSQEWKDADGWDFLDAEFS